MKVIVFRSWPIIKFFVDSENICTILLNLCDYYFMYHSKYFIFMANIILTEKIYASANFKMTVTNFAAYMLHQYIRTNRKELKIQQIGERVYYDDGQVVEKTLSRAITFSIPREKFAFPADRKLMVYEMVDELPEEEPFFTIQLVGVGAGGLFLPIVPSLLANAAKRRLRYWSSDMRIDICFQHFYPKGSFVLNSERISLFDEFAMMIPPLCFYGLVLILCGNCCSLFCDGLGRCSRRNGGSCGLFNCRLCGGLGCCCLCGTGLATVLGVGYGVLVKRYGEIAEDALVTVILGFKGGYECGVGLELNQVVEP